MIEFHGSKCRGTKQHTHGVMIGWPTVRGRLPTSVKQIMEKIEHASET